MDELDFNENIIEDLNLTELQILNIISKWYTNGMMHDIIWDCECRELDEIVEDLFFEKLEEENLIRSIKL
jgi:hypothetical protein